MRLAIDNLTTRRELRLRRPRTPKQLRGYVSSVLGFTIPKHPIVPGHVSPLEYLKHAFFEEHEPRDCIVWANRGGGKTQLGAIATLLDMLFKPGIQVRILAGSFEQSSKMYRYLKRFLEDELFHDLVAGNVTGRYVELRTGSRVEVLAQSDCSVRGQRVHRLRCDEVELFRDDIWEAAQFVTRSGWCGDTYVRASIESLSTMHLPFGLMQRLVQDADRARRRLFQWSVLDTLEHCPPQRECEPCRLWLDCQGRAKDAEGFIDIDDAIRMRDRVGDRAWNAEMLCEMPDRSASVYDEFDPDLHVFDHIDPPPGAMWIGGMDFGYRAPTVLLWAFIMEDVIYIVDELHVEERTVEEHIEAARNRKWPRPTWIGADPAGHQRSDQTGVSSITLWKRAGWPIRSRRIGLQEGITAVKRRLLGPPVALAGRNVHRVRLKIHRRCDRLIKALTMYHYPPEKPESLEPVKDGHDHAADALRYMVINLDATSARASIRTY